MNLNQIADIVISSNSIFTGKEDNPYNGAIAIKDNVILDIGTYEEISPYIHETTTVLHYKDQLILPGFNDFHIHLFLGSLSKDSVSLLEAKTEQEAAQMVKDFADTRPKDPWIFGFNWYHVHWNDKNLPHRFSLDKVLPDRPVFLLNDECHGAWVNSKALEVMGINKDTPNPPFGEIAKDEDGNPTGFLYETAMTFAQKAFNHIPKWKQVELLHKFQDYAASLGVTSVSDMLPLPGLELGNLDVYKEFDLKDNLKVRIHFLSTMNGNLNQAKEYKELYNSPKLKFSGLKQFLDGVPTTYTALLVDPYSDKPETKGTTLIPVDYIQDWIVDADKNKFRIRLHACGDGAVRLGLDCFERARKLNGSWDSRHTIEHIEVIHQDDIHRFHDLNVIASMQPEHMAPTVSFKDNVYPIRVGKERNGLTFPIKTLQEANAKIAFGTDFPVVDLDPMREIYRAITRLHDDETPTNGWNAKEKITLADALRHYTIDSAYSAFREQELGTLEKGKLADIVVLDSNLFEIPIKEVKNAKVDLTIMDGKIVYKR